MCSTGYLAEGLRGGMWYRVLMGLMLLRTYHGVRAEAWGWGYLAFFYILWGVFLVVNTSSMHRMEATLSGIAQLS